MKAYDLSHQKFGRLTALYKCNYKKGNKYPWHCICDCGKEIDVPTDSLTSGKTQSCGCLQKEKASTIGKQTIKIAREVRRQQTDLTGRQFGRLKVLNSIYDDKNVFKWRCQCQCGNIINIKAHDLISGNTSSCGCLISKGQEKIASLLTEYNISFESEKSFDNCYYPDTKGHCRFDFYVDNSYLIEFDGIQHFQENSFFTISLEQQQQRDTFKNEWCKQNNIPLIRIPYTHLSDLAIKDLILTTSDFIINI